MKFSKKTNQLILFALLILIITTGVFIFLSYKNDKLFDEDLSSDNSTIDTAIKGNSTDVYDVSTDKNNMYYAEKLLYELSNFGSIGRCVLKYKDSVVKFIFDDNVIKLVDISNDKVINDFSSIKDDELFSKDVYFIDDDINFFTAEYNSENNQVIIKKFDSDGNKTDRSIILNDFQGTIFDYDGIKNASFSKIMVDDSYIYLLSGTNTNSILQIFDMSGNLYKTYTDLKDFDIDGDKNLFISGYSNYISILKKINLKTDEVAYQVDTKSFGYGYLSYSKGDDYLYYLDRDKIRKYNAQNGEILEEVLNFGVDTSYFTDNLRINSFAVDGRLNLYMHILVSSDNRVINKCYKYESVEGIRPEKAITLTITSPYRQDFLHDAIMRYELKYPDQKVEYDYEYISRDEFYINQSNYGKNLTSRILTNDIGDLVLTGGSTLIFRNLFETDAFMDLSDLIENDKNYDALNKKALDGITIDNSIRGLPVSIIYNFFEVNIALLEKMHIELDYENLKWSDVLDLLSVIEEKAPDSYLFMIDNTGIFEGYMDSIMEIMLIANMPDLIDIENKKVNLNQEWFTDLLKKLKEASSNENFIQKNAKFDIVNQIKDSLFVYRANINTYRSELTGRYYLFNKDSKKTEYIPLFKGEKSDNRVAKTMNMYSINNRSENKENAWKFLSFLLEEEIQTRDNIPGTALNLEAERNIYPTWKEKYFEENGKDWLEMMEPIYTDIDYLYDLDYFKNDIKAPILEYLSDKLSLEEAVKKAEDNVWVRLNE